MSILLKMFRKDEGFTLVELMVVVLIIGILVAIAVPVFLNASDNAKAKSCQANQRTVLGAINTYNATNPTAPIAGTASDSLLSGAGYTALFTGTSASIKSVPVCPSGGAYTMKLLAFTGDTGTASPGWVNATHTLP